MLFEGALVFFNFSNAFKFTQEEGTITVDISQGKREESFSDGYVEIKISDNGIGIEEDHLAKVFERFYQVDNSTTRLSTGSYAAISLTGTNHACDARYGR